jgi:hypothetical protein
MPITHQEYLSWCSGALTWMPGVFGSSIISASGGVAVPSTLRWRRLASRAVMASSEGMFLYPLTGGLPFGSCCSALSFSSFSLVRGSTGPPLVVAGAGAGAGAEGAVSLDGVCGADPAPLTLALLVGLPDLVVGGFTVVESEVAAVEMLVVELVRRANAGRRGRDADDVLEGAPALMLMRAASWLSDGRRALVGFVVVVGVDSAPFTVEEDMLGDDSRTRSTTNGDQLDKARHHSKPVGHMRCNADDDGGAIRHR